MKFAKGNRGEMPVTVRFPIPRAAASKLRTLALSKDRRLLDFGVLAVKISEGENIVLGIKLGKRRSTKTEVDGSFKLRVAAGKGRVVKSTTCRNVGTIHHMPNADKHHTIHHELSAVNNEVPDISNEKNGEVVSEKWNHGFVGNRGSNNKLPHGFRFPSPSHTTNEVQSLNGRPDSMSIDFRDDRLQQNAGMCDRNQPAVRSPVSCLNTCRQVGPKMQARSLSPVSESSLGITSPTIPSPRSQRARSTSSDSDTSSLSSEENLDTHQLVYSCFIDRSKYSAADMLKQLADNHVCKESTKEVKSISAVLCSGSSTSCRTSLVSKQFKSPDLQLEASNDKNSLSIEAKSYTAHLESASSNTSAVTTVSSSAPVNTDAGDLAVREMSCNSTFPKVSIVGHVVKSQVIWESKGVSKSTNNAVTNGSPSDDISPKPRKVLWSSANAFSNRTWKTNYNGTSTGNPGLCGENDNYCNNINCDSISQILSPKKSCCDKINSTNTGSTMVRPHSTFDDLDSTKGLNNRQVVSQTETLNKPNLSDQDSKAKVTSDPLLLVQSTNASCSLGLRPSSSNTSNFSRTNTRHDSNISVSLVLSNTASRIPLVASDSLVGTNTQTTWSSQQVSPTYLVGAQTQFGIYQALYQGSVGTNHQVNSATYPVNYVYPVSFVYPYLAVAQPNSVTNVGKESVKEQGTESVNQVTDADYHTSDKRESKNTSQKENEVTATPAQTASIVVPTQTQFIDLASSMRYWQQFSLLYRSRWQAVAACNLANAQNATSNGDKTVAPSEKESKGIPVSNKDQSVTENVLKLDNRLSTKLVTAGANDLTAGGQQQLPVQLSRDANNSYVESVERGQLQIPVVVSEGIEDIVAERPSVIVSNSFRGSINNERVDKSKGTSALPFTESLEGNNRLSLVATEVRSCTPSPVQNHVVELKGRAVQMERKSPVAVKQNLICPPPQLSFIHDNAIACVNVGSNVVGIHSNNKRTGPSGAPDPVIRPAKRKKSKRSS